MVDREQTRRDDRTVHAEGIAAEVVRYDRSGKWYIEPKNGAQRRHVGVNEAAEWAAVAATAVFTGRPGGVVFDRRVARERGTDG